MNTTSPEIVATLTAHFSAAFAKFLPAKAASDEWDSTLQILRKHGLLEKLVDAPFSKIGFSRVSLNIQRSRVHETEHLTEVSNWLAVELVHLLKRELTTASAQLVTMVPFERIITALHELPLNHSTANGIAAFLMSRTMDETLDASPEITKIFSALDDRFATIGRVIARDSDKRVSVIKERINRHFDAISQQLRDCTGLAELEAQRSRTDCAEKPVCCPSCTPPGLKGSNALVEQQCKRYLRDHPQE
jgi:hypothetical protein